MLCYLSFRETPASCHCDHVICMSIHGGLICHACRHEACRHARTSWSPSRTDCKIDRSRSWDICTCMQSTPQQCVPRSSPSPMPAHAWEGYKEQMLSVRAVYGHQDPTYNRLRAILSSSMLQCRRPAKVHMWTWRVRVWAVRPLFARWGWRRFVAGQGGGCESPTTPSAENWANGLRKHARMSG